MKITTKKADSVYTFIDPALTATAIGLRTFSDRTSVKELIENYRKAVREGEAHPEVMYLLPTVLTMASVHKLLEVYEDEDVVPEDVALEGYANMAKSLRLFFTTDHRKLSSYASKLEGIQSYVGQFIRTFIIENPDSLYLIGHAKNMNDVLLRGLTCFAFSDLIPKEKKSREKLQQFLRSLKSGNCKDIPLSPMSVTPGPIYEEHKDFDKVSGRSPAVLMFLINLTRISIETANELIDIDKNGEDKNKSLLHVLTCINQALEETMSSMELSKEDMLNLITVTMRLSITPITVTSMIAFEKLSEGSLPTDEDKAIFSGDMITFGDLEESKRVREYFLPIESTLQNLASRLLDTMTTSK